MGRSLADVDFKVRGACTGVKLMVVVVGSEEAKSHMGEANQAMCVEWADMDFRGWWRCVVG
jgi:hypothetical protein